MIRAIVAVLAILAIGKIYVQYNFYRTAADAAIISAYRSAAISACQKSQSNMSKGAARYLWSRPQTINVIVGYPSLDVRLWDIENPQWEKRYREANLVLRSRDQHTGLTCRFNLKTGRAAISNA